ncbi:MAG: hypothetical protein K0R27_5121 [Xanthobacteraceae bacterium]|nr:hypothetical protein [Xanthobacteraceae bacterium]
MKMSRPGEGLLCVETTATLTSPDGGAYTRMVLAVLPNDERHPAPVAHGLLHVTTIRPEA